MVAPLAAFLVVPIIVRGLLGITSRLGIFAAGEPSGKLWDRSFDIASILLFVIIAPTIGALAKAQLWCVVNQADYCTCSLWTSNPVVVLPYQLVIT